MVKHEVRGVMRNSSSVSRSDNGGQHNYSASRASVHTMTVILVKGVSSRTA
jgi:hypothetical protein